MTTESGRNAFLQRYFRELADWRERDLRMSSQEQVEERELERFERQSRRLLRWRRVYEASLPTAIMARCPFSGELFEHSFDRFGLDGFWWNHDAPLRPYSEPLPTYFALTGAVSLAKPLERASFLCKPGPGVPYVLPILLENPDIQAVVRELPVGPHRAFAITYFARNHPTGLAPPNEWGTNRAYLTQGESIGWVSQVEDPASFDFQLKPWLETGKLHWIARDDASVNLCSNVESCPYLDLPGERRIQRIENGKVWTE
jgi:hypothetical protein